mgnify:CR=1 FL=1
MSALELTLERGRLRAELNRRGRSLWQAEAPFDSPTDLANLIAALPGQEGFDPSVRRVRVTLTSPLVQRRTLRDLPPVSPGALREMIAQQQQRFFRRNGHPLLTNARWLPSERSAPRVAEAVAIESPWLEALGEGVQHAGLRLERVGVNDSPLTLLPPDEAMRRARAARRHLRWLGAACVACWLGALALHVGTLMLADRRLAAERTQLERPATALRQARRELSTAAGVVATVQQTAARREAMQLVVARIVKALPDSAYLATITLDSSGNGALTGAARQSSAVVARLDRADQLPAVKLDGEPMAGGPGDWERFTILLGKGRTR